MNLKEMNRRRKRRGEMLPPFLDGSGRYKIALEISLFPSPFTMFSGARRSYDIPPDSPVPKRNDRQKIELNVEILEGHLGCMKSTHSMNAATWGR